MMSCEMNLYWESGKTIGASQNAMEITPNRKDLPLDKGLVATNCYLFVMIDSISMDW